MNIGEEINVNKIRSDFPILTRTVHGKPLVYLDNAATSQKPAQVIDTLADYYRNYNANVHRGMHQLAVEADEAYEKAREKTARFVGAPPKEIIFTRNTTESINLIAYTLGLQLGKGDKVVTTIMEHHSNIVPWQSLRRNGVQVDFVDIDDNGFLRKDQLEEMIDENTKIVALAHASNVLGTINDIRSITQYAHDRGAVVVVDGAQSAPHMPVDVKQLGCDFFAFSAHKMLGPTGVGVLYGKHDLLENMPPFMMGGDMIKEVYTDHTTFAAPPSKFEGGTPSIADAIAFGAAIDYLERIGMERIRKHEAQLNSYVMQQLATIEGLHLYGSQHPGERASVFSFTMRGIHPHDITSLLDDAGIAIRSGHACAMPLMQRLNVNSVARASFYIYNTAGEADTLVAALKHVKSIFKV